MTTRTLVDRAITKIAEIDTCTGCHLEGRFCSRHGAPVPVTMPHLARAVLDSIDLTTDRRTHCLGVGRRMTDLLEVTGLAARTSPLAQDRLVASALLHDVGYSTEARTPNDLGHHAVDGGLWLGRCGAPAFLVSSTAWHSTADWEATARGEDLAGMLSLISKPTPVDHALLWVADFQTTPTGEPTPAQHRYDEIRSRYPSDSPVIAALETSIPDFNNAQRILASLPNSRFQYELVH